MARMFENFESINMGDFVPFEEGYHVLTITGHKEDNRNGKDIDIFEVTSDEGATTNLTLYYTQNAYWTYKKLMAVCGAKVDQLKGNQNLNLDNLIGKRFGAYVTLEAVEKWDENKGAMVTKHYPRINMTKVFSEEKTQELKKSFVAPVKNTTPANTQTNDNFFGTPTEDEPLPF